MKLWYCTGDDLLHYIHKEAKKEAYSKLSITQVNFNSLQGIVYIQTKAEFTLRSVICVGLCACLTKGRGCSSHDVSSHHTPTTSRFKIYKLEDFNLASDVSCNSEDLQFCRDSICLHCSLPHGLLTSQINSALLRMKTKNSW